MTNPGDAKTGFAVPAAFYFDDLAGGGEIGDAVEAGAVFADVHGVRTLRERIAVAIFAANKNAQSLRSAGGATRHAPKICRGLVESEAHIEAASSVGILENDADFLLFLGKSIDDKKIFAELDGSLENDESAAGVEQKSSGVFVKGAERFAPAINHYWNVEGFAFAGTIGLSRG